MSIAEKVIADIDAAYAADPPRSVRSYIGASLIGDKCDAALEFSLRGFPGSEPEPKLARIFRDGHRIENEVVRDLKKAGYRVLERDELTGRQFRYELAGGHVVCNTDGLIFLDPAADEVSLLEIKSMNQTLWNKFKKHGVKVSHPKYWDQMQMMMGMSGIRSCLFISYCKNDSQYHAEVVDFDEFEWSYLKARIVTVFEGEARKISDDPESFLCRFCFKKPSCWGGVIPDTRCSTCSEAAPTSDGGWWCGLHKKDCADPCGDWRPWQPKDK